MKIIISLAVLAAFSATAGAYGSFVTVGGNGNGCTFTVEPAVSGFAKGADGTVISHGAMVPAAYSLSAVEEVGCTVEDATGPTEVITLDGRILVRYNEGEFDLHTLEPGVYIVRQGTKTTKFVNPAR